MTFETCKELVTCQSSDWATNIMLIFLIFLNVSKTKTLIGATSSQVGGHVGRPDLINIFS